MRRASVPPWPSLESVNSATPGRLSQGLRGTIAPTFRTPGGFYPRDLKAKPSKDLLEDRRRKNQKDVKKRQ